MGRMLFLFLATAMLNSLEASSQLNLKRPTDTPGRKISLSPLPQNFYKQNLGYFCKKELQLQKATSLPIFIRLGSKEYIDYLERKPNALKRD
jgi:hypothetical protein